MKCPDGDCHNCDDGISDQCYECGYQDGRKSVLKGTQPTIDNIDYTVALEKELSTVLLKEWNCAMKEQVKELATRLNSVVKAQQNCA